MQLKKHVKLSPFPQDLILLDDFLLASNQGRKSQCALFNALYTTVGLSGSMGTLKRDLLTGTQLRWPVTQAIGWGQMTEAVSCVKDKRRTGVFSLSRSRCEILKRLSIRNGSGATYYKSRGSVQAIAFPLQLPFDCSPHQHRLASNPMMRLTLCLVFLFCGYIPGYQLLVIT